MTEKGTTAEYNSSPASGLVEQQRWFMKFQQSLAKASEAEMLTKCDAGIESLDANRGIPASEALQSFVLKVTISD